jgi:hypothetical protein
MRLIELAHLMVPPCWWSDISFTRGFWQDYFALHVGRDVWIHHEQCGFVVGVVESFKPDIVVLAPVERQMFCFGGR